MSEYTAATAARRAEAGTDAEEGGTRQIGAVLGDLMQDVSTLVQQEVELAKAEVRQSAAKAGQSAGMFAGAAVAAHLFVVFLSIALWWAIGDRIGPGWSAVIVAFIWLAVGGLLFVVARTQLQKISGLDHTAATLAKVPNALKGHEERNR